MLACGSTLSKHSRTRTGFNDPLFLTIKEQQYRDNIIFLDSSETLNRAADKYLHYFRIYGDNNYLRLDDGRGTLDVRAAKEILHNWCRLGLADNDIQNTSRTVMWCTNRKPMWETRKERYKGSFDEGNYAKLSLDMDEQEGIFMKRMMEENRKNKGKAMEKWCEGMMKAISEDDVHERGRGVIARHCLRSASIDLSNMKEILRDSISLRNTLKRKTSQ